MCSLRVVFGIVKAVEVAGIGRTGRVKLSARESLLSSFKLEGILYHTFSLSLVLSLHTNPLELGGNKSSD